MDIGIILGILALLAIIGVCFFFYNNFKNVNTFLIDKKCPNCGSFNIDKKKISEGCGFEEIEIRCKECNKHITFNVNNNVCSTQF